MHGDGTFTYKDGNQYVGHYWEDRKEGYGELYYSNGDIYKGYWKDGK